MNKPILSTIILSAFMAFLPMNAVFSQSATSIVGRWTSIDDETNRARSIINITQRNGVYYGRVLRVFKQPGDKGICEKCPGAFKNKPIKGLQIMWGLRKTGGNVWSGGKILDPKKGKIYRVKLTSTPSGRTLNVRGYIGISLLGRTQVWHRR